jgi:antitoxin FitA
MPQLTVRNVPEKTVRALRVRAAKHGRSAEAEHRLILEQALRSADDFWAEADRLRAETVGTKQTPSEVLIREMRDER